MIYRTHRPGPPLSEYVDWFWFYDDLQVAHRMERVLPDGTFEWIIDLRDVPRKLFSSEAAAKFVEYRRSWISGTRDRYITIDVLNDASMIGVHFKPGGAAAFLGCPADELAECVAESDSVWGREVNALREALLEEATIGGRFALLEKFLLMRLRQPDARVTAAIRWLAGNPEAARIENVADQLGMTQKHFITVFREQTGMTPKKFCRVRRFQRALREIEATQALEWTTIANDAGYYDQSHFIRDFHAFSGMNPSMYLTQKGEHLGFLPVRM